MSVIAYKAGDLVHLTHNMANQPRLGPFEILRVMPSRDNAEEQYRVRGPDGLERAIGHHEIVEDGAHQREDVGSIDG
ncbi:hypothetical protein [Bosea sp. BK604]|uniref:hypothetical protein n=1 Tax=Bosea sp. BK604 TaxID=2512180 RepID=UPI00104DB911|nr:hypothetical protein [Bosea sp. BK604]TCR63467.1 hypothetical protein EV560_108114 [Bosea sp. BK604]